MEAEGEENVESPVSEVVQNPEADDSDDEDLSFYKKGLAEIDKLLESWGAIEITHV